MPHPKYLLKSLLLSTSFLLASTISAQDWTWVHGDSMTGQQGIYASNDPKITRPGAMIHGTTWTDNAGNLWLFGGLGYSASGQMGHLNDLWKYNPQTNCWKRISGSNGINQGGSYTNQGSFSPLSTPGARARAISWTDPSGKLWLYGGLGFAGGIALTFSDLWQYDPTSGNWAWMGGTWNEAANYGTITTPGPANTPGERIGSTSWTDLSGNLWLFGGGTSVNFKSDLWKYTPSTNQWTWMHGSDLTEAQGVYGMPGVPDPANKPGARIETFCFKDKDNNFWLFGGYGFNAGGGPGHLNDLWKFDPVLNQWAWMQGTAMINQPGTYGTQGSGDPGTMPGGRIHVSGWVDSVGNVWAFGGMGFAATGTGFGVERLNDLWKYDPVTNIWTWMKGSDTYNSLSTYGELLIPDPANTPGARSDFMSWSNDRGLWLFGGNGFPGSPQQEFGYQNDLWRFGQDTLTFTEPALPETAVMPNVFSPNSDGLNDFFVALQLPPSSSYVLTVLNRWGDPVFKTNDPAASWDGTSGGELCADGVYFWRVQLEKPVGGMYSSSGFVTLLR